MLQQLIPDCKNAYTAAIAYNTDYTGITVGTAYLATGGYTQTGGVTTGVTAWVSESSFTITRSGDPNWVRLHLLQHMQLPTLMMGDFRFEIGSGRKNLKGRFKTPLFLSLFSLFYIISQ